MVDGGGAAWCPSWIATLTAFEPKCCPKFEIAKSRKSLSKPNYRHYNKVFQLFLAGRPCAAACPAQRLTLTGPDVQNGQDPWFLDAHLHATQV